MAHHYNGKLLGVGRKLVGKGLKRLAQAHAGFQSPVMKSHRTILFPVGRPEVKGPHAGVPLLTNGKHLRDARY